MNMKTFFTFLIVVIFSIFALSKSSEPKDNQKAILSYALPSTLDWRQSTDEGFDKELKLFTLDDDTNIKFHTLQVGNQELWPSISKMDKEAMFKELTDGKKIIHALSGYKDWKAEKSLEKKSDKEIVFTLDGSYIDDKVKKHFIEKYYMTPYGFIVATLTWTDAANKELAKKAETEFKNISFKSEIK